MTGWSHIKEVRGVSHRTIITCEILHVCHGGDWMQTFETRSRDTVDFGLSTFNYQSFKVRIRDISIAFQPNCKCGNFCCKHTVVHVGATKIKMHVHY